MGGDKSGRRGSGRPKGPAFVTDDARFQSMHSDPRFARMPAKSRKVEIDDRFKAMFEDERFQSRVAVDKRGKKADRKKGENLRRYYRLQGEDDEGEGPKDRALASPSPSGDEGEERGGRGGGERASGRGAEAGQDARGVSGNEEGTARGREGGRGGAKGGRKAARAARAAMAPSEEAAARRAVEEAEEEAHLRWARMRGLAGSSSSSSSSSDDEAYDRRGAVGTGTRAGVGDGEGSDYGEEMDEKEYEAMLGGRAVWGAGWDAIDKGREAVPEAEETPRLAVVDLDWSRVRAVDVFAVLASNVPSRGTLRSVRVYLSDYGMERMEAERAKGPQGIWDVERRVAEDMREVEAAQAAMRAAAATLSDDEETGSEGGSDDEGPSGSDGLGEESDGDRGSDGLGSNGDSDEEDSEGGSEGSEGGHRGVGAGADTGASSRNGGAGAEADEMASLPLSKRREVEEALNERLRAYERSKMRWYYAVAEFDSAATALHCYQECDGMEFELSGNVLDLRFVPDSEDFGGRTVRDEATGVPADYRPPQLRQNLNTTHAKLTWDEDSHERRRVLTKKLTEEDIREDDFRVYLASGSDEEEPAAAEEGEPDTRTDAEKYRALLLGEGAEAAPRSGRANWGGGGERGDMTVTFAGGLESLGKRLKERKGAGEETVWEQYLRKKKEKKREKRRQAMRMDDSDADTDGGGSVSGDDGGLERAATEGADPFSDPFFAEGAEGDMEAAMAAEVGGEEGRGAGEKRGKGKRKGRRGEKGDREGSVEGEGAGVDGAEVARRKAELELLMMDDGELRAVASGKTSADVLSKYKGQEKRGAATDGDVGKSKTKKERRKEWKSKKRLREENQSDEEDAGSFRANLDDPRFARLFGDHDYALDPTDPRFKQSLGAKALAEEAARRRSQQQHRPKAAEPAKPQHSASALEKLELKGMVAKLKAKKKKGV